MAAASAIGVGLAALGWVYSVAPRRRVVWMTCSMCDVAWRRCGVAQLVLREDEEALVGGTGGRGGIGGAGFDSAGEWAVSGPARGVVGAVANPPCMSLWVLSETLHRPARVVVGAVVNPPCTPLWVLSKTLPGAGLHRVP